MAQRKLADSDFIKFLGTAGARFVMIKQLRSSGGIWISCGGTNILVDPGPGSIVRLAKSRPRLDPAGLDAIILTHRHLDHCNDINVMIEAMTDGGFKKRGIVFCPSDCLGNDSVILRHVMSFPEKIEYLKPDNDYVVGNFKFTVSPRHLHPVETYGIKFRIKGTSVSLLSDTMYSDALLDFYKTDRLIINVVFVQAHSGVQHLSLEDARNIINKVRPKEAIMTHFGMTMLKAKPASLAEGLSQELGVKVVSAYDGMTLKF